MIDLILAKENRYFRFYFKNLLSKEMGMIFFNEDGSLVLGLSTVSEKVDELVKKLKNDFKSEFVLIFIEAPPPDNKKDFLKLFFKSWIRWVSM